VNILFYLLFQLYTEFDWLIDVCFCITPRSILHVKPRRCVIGRSWMRSAG